MDGELVLEAFAYVCAVFAASVVLSAGLSLLVAPRTTVRVMVAVDRLMRKRLYGGGWNAWERMLPRRGHFYVPSDISLETPDELHQYMLSERSFSSAYFRIVSKLWAVMAVGLAGTFLVGLLISIAT